MPYRFSAAEDIAVFKETIKTNPFQYDEQEEGWVEVAINSAEALEKEAPFLSRTIKNRVLTQMTYHATDNEKTLKKSGTAEEYTTKRKQLQELVELKATWDGIQAEKKAAKAKKQKELMKKMKEKEKAGKALRAAAKKGMVKAADAKKDDSDLDDAGSDTIDAEKGNDEDAPKKKVKRITARQETMSLVEMLKVKAESESSAEQRKLEQEEKRLQLEERRLMLQEMQFRAANPHMFQY